MLSSVTPSARSWSLTRALPSPASIRTALPAGLRSRMLSPWPTSRMSTVSVPAKAEHQASRTRSSAMRLPYALGTDDPTQSSFWK